MLRHTIVILLSFYIGKSTVTAQNDTICTIGEKASKTDTITPNRFEGWTEEEIQHWEDSVLSALYPIAQIGHADSALVTKEKTIIRVARGSYSPIDNSHVPSSVEIDTSKGVGEIPINSGTSPTGAKTYEIPINVYPGMKDMQPKLALTYNSQAGNSVVGMGWRISGLPSITRVGKSYYYDGKAEGVKMDNTDVFLLDGMHLIKQTTYSSYIIYESEVGNIKAKGYINGTTMKYFEVFYPDGKKGVFGYSSNASNKASYPLTSLTDLKGNAINYSYTYTSNNYDISSISYNGASVVFQYDTSRTDTILTFCGGLKIVEPRLLKSVTCKFNTIILGTYTLTHEEYYNHNLLIQVDYTASSQSLNPLRFYYGEGIENFQYRSSTTLLPEYYTFNSNNAVETFTGYFDYQSGIPGLIVHQGANPYWHYHRDAGWNSHSADAFQNIYDNLSESLKTIYVYTGLDTDGYADYQTITMGDGFIKVMCADLQGNQNEDIIKINNSVVNNTDQLTFHVYGMSAYGLVERYSRTYSFPTVYTDHRGNKSIQPKYYYAGDFNGDGKMEILAVSVHEPFGQTAYPSKCYVFDLENNQILYENHLLPYDILFLGSQYSDLQTVENNSDKLLVMDIDADGKTDICHINASGTDSYTFSTSGSTLTGSNLGTYTPLNRSMIEYRDCSPAELNGDMKNDIIVSGLNNTHGTALTQVFYSKGNGQFEKKEYEGWMKSDYTTESFTVQDVNGDGITDLHVYNQYAFSTGMGIYNITANGPTKIFTENSILIPTIFNSRHALTQLLSLKDGILTKYQFPVQSKEQMITGMANSIGVVEKTDYNRLDEDFLAFKQIGEPEIYTPTFPYNITHEPLHAVAQTELFMNGENVDHNVYAYDYAVIHRQGKGFCGFKQITRNNSRNQTYTTLFDPERFGVVTQEVTPEQEVTNTYTVNVASNKIAKIMLTNKVENDLLKGNTATTSYTYDTYGYPLTESTTYSGGLTVNKQNTYASTTTVGNGYNLGFLRTQTIARIKGESMVVEVMNLSSWESRLPLAKSLFVNGNQVEKQTYTYDNHGNPLTDTKRLYASATDHTTSYVYDYYGRVAKITDPLGRITQYTYNTKGQRASMLDYRGNTTNYSYDAFGREASATHPAGIVTATAYNWSTLGTNGLYAVTKTETGKPTTRIIYDALNREVRSSDMRFDGNYRNVDKIYDTYGNLWKVSLPFKGTSPAYWNIYSYDEHNRLLSISEASGRTTTHSYNGNSITTVEDNVSATKTYDALGNMLSVTDAAGTVTYNLDADGQPSSIVAPGNVTTSFTYDSARRRTAINDPSAGTCTYQYDAAGNISKEINANGDSIRYTYDSHNRIVSKTMPEFTTIYTYNANNDLTNVTSTNSTSRILGYDSYGRLSMWKETVDSTWLKKTITYANGNINEIRYESEQGEFMGEYFIYAYGHIKEGKKNGTNLQFKLNSENAMGQPTEIVTGAITRTYTYTPYGLPTGRTAASASQIYQDYSYSFNAMTSNLTSRTDNLNNLTETFSYDNLNRLRVAAGSVTNYDNKGNVTGKTDAGTFQYGLTDKPYAISGVTNPKSLIAQRVQDISYTSFSRPDSITENGYNAAFTYNSEGKRVKMVLSHNGNVVSTKYYLGDCYERVCTGSNVKERIYMFGDYYNATSVCQREGSSDNIFYLLRDYLGSVTNVVIEGGYHVQNVRYDAWGRLRNPYNGVLYTNSNMPEIIFRGYTGHEHMKEFGLINMNARLYDPAIGRFLSPDPFVQMPENSQNFNRYSYALNNPLKYKDKSGKWFIIDDFVIGCIRGLWNGKNILKTGYKQAANSFKIWEGLFTLDSNKNFLEKTWEFISRFTYQSPQTIFGLLYGLTNNTIGNVSQVRHLYGSTVITQSSNWLMKDYNAITLGNFITGGDKLHADPSNPLFQHEYGHYIQSQRYGYAYMTGIGLHSLLDVVRNRENHKYNEIERDANYRAYKYFQENIQGFNKEKWDYDKHPLLPKMYPDRLYYNQLGYLDMVEKSLSISPEWFHYLSGFILAESPLPIF